jgi:NhaA family Na+:H+ antiporter
MNILKKILHNESSAGIFLVIVTIVALLLSNSAGSSYYNAFLHYHFALKVGPFLFDKSLLHWINDALMVIFFLLIGLEVKRELIEGDLSTFSQMLLPGVAAIGGMFVPALVFVLFNYADPAALDGWAIPAATDIAFALGIISLFGKKVPVSLKVFLMALAILDDLGAIIIIALFYTSDISINALLGAFVVTLILIAMNKAGVYKKTPYILIGIVLWAFVLKSGVHATIAGVILAFCIPLKVKLPQKENIISPSKDLEQGLHLWVAFLIIPLFAFANAGIPLDWAVMGQLLQPFGLGVMLGLFLGKQLGVFILSSIIIKMNWANLPKNANWLQFYGICVLTGIGFTMSLFIAHLAFPGSELFESIDRLAVLAGSLLSTIWGLLFVLIGICVQNKRIQSQDLIDD